MPDSTQLQSVLDGNYEPDLILHDINRDGDVTNKDKTRLVELFNGTDTGQAWLNYSLPVRPAEK